MEKNVNRLQGGRNEAEGCWRLQLMMPREYTDNMRKWTSSFWGNMNDMAHDYNFCGADDRLNWIDFDEMLHNKAKIINPFFQYLA